MAQAQNPFFEPFDGPRGTVRFSKIDDSHYMEAIKRGIALAQDEINAIANNPDAPTFENTIVAMDASGRELDRTLGIFYALLSAESNDAMMQTSMEAAPLLSDYSTSIVLNQPLWQRVRSVYDQRDTLDLSPEQKTLLQNTYDNFALSGALLEGADRDRYRELTSRLSQLTTQFGQNVLKEMAQTELWLTAGDLAGLPANVVAEAAQNAADKGREGEYLFTLSAPTYMAFMKNSSRRDLREKMWRLYNGRNTAGEFSNIPVLTEIAETRRQIANLLEADTFARHQLKRTMAKTPENVWNLLNQLREAYTAPMQREIAELTQFASDFEKQDITLMPWDYSYYSNKLKADRYAFDEEALRPYFELNNTIAGVFGLATKLYGLQFKHNPDIEVYHPDVKAFEVSDANGQYLGVLYTDFFPRPSKRQGAWMTNTAEQCRDADGTDHRPHISIVMNFTKPGADTPSLLTPYEVSTFLHEFGHALHGLLAQGNYASLSGTNVYRDFVELPSQFNENYLNQKEFLDGFAKHYQTGEPIPAELIERMIKAEQYGAAYACMRQLMFGFLDMCWHTTQAPVEDAAAFEVAAVAPVQIFAPVDGSMVSPQFSHIFSGGYAAGYYSYKWAEVLDADAFDLFRQNGIFDKATADAFRTNILEKGGSEDPAELYRRFRGQDATIDALLRRDGIKQ